MFNIESPLTVFSKCQLWTLVEYLNNNKLRFIEKVTAHSLNLFSSPETRVWEIGEEDEGIQEDWWSLYSRGSQSLTPRASTGSTMSSFSLGGCLCPSID